MSFLLLMRHTLVFVTTVTTVLLAVQNSTWLPGFVFTFRSAADFVPEPATLSLLGAGLLGVGWAVRRRRHKASPRS